MTTRKLYKNNIAKPAKKCSQVKPWRTKACPTLNHEITFLNGSKHVQTVLELRSIIVLKCVIAKSKILSGKGNILEIFHKVLNFFEDRRESETGGGEMHHGLRGMDAPGPNSIAKWFKTYPDCARV